MVYYIHCWHTLGIESLKGVTSVCQEEETGMQNTMNKPKHSEVKLDPKKLAEKALRLPVKDGVVRLDRHNPAHRAWMEDNK
jgi:hypothetical protein